MSLNEEGRSDKGNLPALFEHVNKKEWGLAIIAWQKPTKRAYQFEDGKLRIMKLGYYHLMQEVDRPADRSAALYRQLSRQVGISEARRELKAEANAKGDVVITLEDQQEILEKLYPGGFAGEAWTTRFRIDTTKDVRRLKRHRSFAIRHAQEALSKQRLSGYLANGNYGLVIGALAEVVEGTDIIRPAHVKAVKMLPEETHEAVAMSLYNLLHGESDIVDRFDVFVKSFPDGASWSLSSGVLGLFDPEEHVCIHTTSFQKEAKWMAPRLKHSTTPSGLVYSRYLDMTKRVTERLKQAGIEPKDLMDVYDFIRITLRPSSLKLLDKVDS